MGGRCSLSSETAVDDKWILIVKPPEQWDKSEPLLGDLCTVREQYVIRISSCKISFIFRVFRKKPPAKRKRLPRQQRHQRFTGQELENILNRSQRQGMIGYIRLTLFSGKLSSFSFVKISEGSSGVQGYVFQRKIRVQFICFVFFSTILCLSWRISSIPGVSFRLYFSCTRCCRCRSFSLIFWPNFFRDAETADLAPQQSKKKIKVSGGFKDFSSWWHKNGLKFRSKCSTHSSVN